MLHNLFSGDRAAQIEAATELGKLKSKQRHKLAERGVMVPLISMLHSEDAEAIEASLFSLLSLAFGSERLVHILYESYNVIVAPSLPLTPSISYFFLKSHGS